MKDGHTTRMSEIANVRRKTSFSNLKKFERKSRRERRESYCAFELQDRHFSRCEMLMWIIWRERNGRCFEDQERSMEEHKKLFI
jgi:hypothetical protein